MRTCLLGAPRQRVPQGAPLLQQALPHPVGTKGPGGPPSALQTRRWGAPYPGAPSLLRGPPPQGWGPPELLPRGPSVAAALGGPPGRRVGTPPAAFGGAPGRVGGPQGAPFLAFFLRPFSSHLLAQLGPPELLQLAKELQQEPLMKAEQGLSAAAVAAAVRRAQRACRGAPTPGAPGPQRPLQHRLGGPPGAPVAADEIWGQLLFLLHGGLQQLQPGELCTLLRVLAEGGPQGPLGGPQGHLKGPRSLLYPKEEGPAAANSPEGKPMPGGPLHAAAATAAAAAAAAEGRGAAGGPQGGPAEPDLCIRRGALGRGPQWCPDLLRDLEEEEAAALQQLGAPLGVGAPPAAATAGAPTAAAAAGAPLAAAAAGALVEVWHAALSLQLHVPLLAAAALRGAEETLMLLPLASKIHFAAAAVAAAAAADHCPFTAALARTPLLRP
ncbi:hypothetical protein, conserved [Eimeria tenella]|uniref:Uncharacterized protein n=1 Tax=Eimeria tenella TaxID=5802 RepID=U6KNZ5_EIMTE|nr:hypothetical protein, conserved [Eimeria tenella]CDJ38541.1 hypothetical protein, conserved [Eimeria tenella]|eukprot:XP_013229379.1 hypothetical protein, conserved [Eimeria tenella]